MSIKKAFQDVVAFLEENSGSEVKTVLPVVIEMCSAKSGGAGGASAYIKDAEGTVTHIRCYYHGKWEPVADVEYGVKATSATGLSSMCKEGTSNWTKQQAAAKKAGAQLLNLVAAGDVAPSDIGAVQEEIETARKVVVPREDGIGEDVAPS